MEALVPGTNERIVNGTAPLVDVFGLGFVARRAAKHTEAAHASGGPLTDTCFWVTLPSIVTAVGYVALAVTLALTLAGAALVLLGLFMTPFVFCVYGTWASLQHVLAVWVYDVYTQADDVEPTKKQQ